LELLLDPASCAAGQVKSSQKSSAIEEV